MSASLTIEIKGLERLAERFSSPEVINTLMKLPQEKAIAALVGQAIADNFDQQGPGWAPLTPQTIRRSVSKKLRKKLAHSMTDEGLVRFEASQRKQGKPGHRQILKRTGLLMKTVTTPNYAGAGGSNIWRSEGTKLIWGTNLHYAGIHNYGGTINHPGTKNGFGRGIKIPPYQIPMPQREFLKISDHWRNQILDYVVERCLRAIEESLKRGE